MPADSSAEPAIPTVSGHAQQPIISPFLQRVQAVHASQGRTNDCGPFSTAMVINAMTPLKVDPPALGREMEHIAWWGPLPILRRIPGWATFPWGVVDVLRRHGLKARWLPFCGSQRLVSALNRGEIPILFIGGWRPLWGHVLILQAYDPLLGWGFVDPARANADLHWLDPPLLIKEWRTFANSVVMVTPGEKAIMV